MSAPDLPGDGELFEIAPCGLLTTDGRGAILRANVTFCAWLGYGRDEIVGRRRFQDLLTIGGEIFHQTHWLPLLEIQGSIAEVQLELVHRDGHQVPVLVNALRYPGEPVRHDIAVFVATDRRKYERELVIARKRAEELLESERVAQAKLAEVLREQEQAAQLRVTLTEQLVGIVSHDLRSPLNAILLGAALLEKTKESPLVARVVSRMTSSARRANRLIDDLLDFTQARLGTGLRVTPVPMDLHDVVAGTVDELRLASPERALEHRSVGPGAVEADADRLAQVVTNLVSNALTYGAPEHPVTVTTSVTDAELRIDVHNRGPAIPEPLLPHIFEPMRRGEHQLQPGSRSVGLGLYIVHEIAAAHRGAVTVASTPADGTTFSMSAPRLAGVGA